MVIKYVCFQKSMFRQLFQKQICTPEGLEVTPGQEELAEILATPPGNRTKQQQSALTEAQNSLVDLYSGHTPMLSDIVFRPISK